MHALAKLLWTPSRQLHACSLNFLCLCVTRCGSAKMTSGAAKKINLERFSN